MLSFLQVCSSSRTLCSCLRAEFPCSSLRLLWDSTQTRAASPAGERYAHFSKVFMMLLIEYFKYKHFPGRFPSYFKWHSVRNYARVLHSEMTVDSPPSPCPFRHWLCQPLNHRLQWDFIHHHNSLGLLLLILILQCGFAVGHVWKLLEHRYAVLLHVEIWNKDNPIQY